MKQKMVESDWIITDNFLELFPCDKVKVLILHGKDLAVNCRQRKSIVVCSHDAVYVTEYGRSGM
jgi:hypothetical protein